MGLVPSDNRPSRHGSCDIFAGLYQRSMGQNGFVSLEAVADELERDGVRKFAESWSSLLTVLERKAAVLATRA